MDFYQKYLKYKKKYLELKKIQSGGGIVPPEREISIGHDMFDVEELVRLIRLDPNNPINPKTNDIISHIDLWRIIKKYNNYANSANPEMRLPIKLFNYNQTQFREIENGIINENNSYLPVSDNIKELINNIIKQPPQSPQSSQPVLPNPNSNVNSIDDLVPGTIYIFINANTGEIGRTLPYINTENDDARFGENENIINMNIKKNLFFNNVPNAQLPQRLQPNELVPGISYVEVTYLTKKYMQRTKPFTELTSDPGMREAGKFGTRILNLRFSYLFSEPALNQIGIFLNN